MKRLTVLSARALIVALLALAVLDVQIPGASRARRRLHLVDRSRSVTLEGGLAPKDADEIRAADPDARTPGDEISWASFGRNVAFESAQVDPSATDLAGALESALARNPTEIVLYTDGRADPGRALFLCRERGVPVHVFPLGPPAPRDVRISRIAAPAQLAAGERGVVEVTLDSTFDTPATVFLDGESRDVALAAGIPLTVPFPGRGPGGFTVRVGAQDDLDRNNSVAGRIEERSEKRRILVLSDGSFPPDPDFKVVTAFQPPDPFDVVVLAGLRLDPAQQKALAGFANGSGGVLLLGGPASYERGGWKGTPIEEISPLRASPDQKVAVVFGIDSSGSMEKVWDTVTRAVADAREAFDAGDAILAMTFARDATFLDWEALRRVRPRGPTNIANGIKTARERLRSIDAGRKHLFLFTDGDAAEGEKERQREEAELLGEIALTVVTTDRTINAPRARQVRIGDWNELERSLADLLRGLRENGKANPGALDLQAHPATAGVGRVELPWMNLTSAKPGSQVVGTVGRAPAVYPAVAFRTTGGGATGAFAFPYDPRLRRLLVQSAEHVAGDAAEGIVLTVDPPLVRARSAGSLPKVMAGPREVPMARVRSDLWEGTLPELDPGTVTVRCGRARASATIVSSPEDAAVGLDRRALERIAGGTGGRVLRSTDDLPALPRPERPDPRSGRPAFLVAALALVFIELGLTTFWKER